MSSALILLPIYGARHNKHLESMEQVPWSDLKQFGLPIDQARNLLVDKALKTEADVFLFIDSDMEFTLDDCYKVIEPSLETKGIIFGCCTQKSQKKNIVGEPAGTDAIGNLFPARKVGMAFTAIHRSVFERIPIEECLYAREDVKLKPYFLPMIYEGRYWGEDYSFCIRAEQAKIPMYIALDAKITHWGEAGYRFD